MAIIKQYHKDTDTIYVYESVSYWDADKGQSRSRRKCIGKIDPATGEMVPTGKRGRQKKETTPSHPGEDGLRIQHLYEKEQSKVKELEMQKATLEQELASVKKQRDQLQAALRKIQDLASGNFS